MDEYFKDKSRAERRKFVFKKDKKRANKFDEGNVVKEAYKRNKKVDYDKE